MCLYPGSCLSVLSVRFKSKKRSNINDNDEEMKKKSHFGDLGNLQQQGVRHSFDAISVSPFIAFSFSSSPTERCQVKCLSNSTELTQRECRIEPTLRLHISFKTYWHLRFHLTCRFTEFITFWYIAATYLLQIDKVLFPAMLFTLSFF